jgi:hypothetical protein
MAQEVRHIAKGKQFVLLPPNLRGIGNFIRPSRFRTVPVEAHNGHRLKHGLNACVASQDGGTEEWRRSNAVTKGAQSSTSCLSPELEGERVIADFPRGTFDQRKLVSQQNELVRLFDDPQGHFGSPKNSLDGSSGALDGVGNRPHGTRSRKSYRTHSRHPEWKDSSLARNGKFFSKAKAYLGLNYSQRRRLLKRKRGEQKRWP